MADSVAKVENRAAPKISRKSILRRSYRCKPYSGDTKVRGRFCVKRCGPFISPRAKRISGTEKFWSSSQKDFFNTIGTKLPNRNVGSSVAVGVKPDMTRTAQFGRE
jgi:hypothetical protein